MRDRGGNIKRDLALISGLLAAALLISLVMFFRGSSRKEAGYAVIRVDGKEVARYDLGRNASVPIDTAYGHNLLVIRDGEAKMEEADCPDGYCMGQGAIRSAGDVIVCLPHRLVIEAAGETQKRAGNLENPEGPGSPDGGGTSDPDEVDAVAR